MFLAFICVYNRLGVPGAWQGQITPQRTLRCYTVAALPAPPAGGCRADPAAPLHSEEGTTTATALRPAEKGPAALREPVRPARTARPPSALGSSGPRGAPRPVPEDSSSARRLVPTPPRPWDPPSPPRRLRPSPPGQAPSPAPVPGSPGGRRGTAQAVPAPSSALAPQAAKAARERARRSPDQACAPGCGLGGWRPRLSPASPPRLSEATG